jgi:guanylate kinase
VEKEGSLVIVSGPSGAGKTSIVEKAIAESKIGRRIVTCTTRRPRQREVDGEDYYFLSREDFVQKLGNGEFAEHAEVYGNFYGTLASDIAAVRKDHPVAYLITDVQGAATVMKKYPDAWSVFITTSMEDLVERLVGRGEHYHTVTARVAQFDEEVGEARHFEYVLQNKNAQLEDSVREFLRHVERCYREDELTHLHNPPNATD